MVTNTVVLTLTPSKDDSKKEEALKACGDVAFFRLQTGLQNFDDLLNNQDVQIISLVKSFRKILLVCKDNNVSEQVYNCLMKKNIFYKIHYSRQNTVIDTEKNNQSFLKIPQDIKSKFLISPPHTPRYKNFSYIVYEEDPIELNKLNNKLLDEAEMAEGDSRTRILLKDTGSGVNITLTDCCDDKKCLKSNECVYKTQLPPTSIFDDLE
ncbi:uncharacterized protein HGUI_03086 [Hanseniaspora guilliermondii]|uniref:Calcipressin-like protein n=1 Tax=Hanseniaspora guilliermondii TaxID=56406 RepID=A0A1L0FMV1_9ASCO|nr:uncharacterized protein HGUI_03086 [Hanseniaspora guilliermondii]